MKHKKLTSVHGSGGSTKGAGEAGFLHGLHASGYRVDLISGVSVSAINAVPAAMGKFAQMKSLYLSDNLLKKFWSIAPIKENGDFSILNASYVLLRDKTAIGDMRKLKKVIASIISYEDFMEYQDNNDYPICLIMTVDFKTGARKLFNLKDKSITYSKYLDLTLASSSIPVFNNYVRYCEGDTEMFLYDGGTRDHIATHYVLEKSGYDFDTIINVFTRPEDYKIDQDWKPKDVLNVLMRSIDFLNIEVSKGDEAKIHRVWKELDKDPENNYMVFMPSILESLYDTDKTRLRALYQIGYRKGLDLGKKLLNK